MTAVDVTRWAPNGRDVRFHPHFGGRWSPEPRRPDGSRYPSMGLLAAAWVQATCGLKLDLWQVEAMRRAWLYDPDTLDWIVEDILIVGPEGIGKSAWTAALAGWFLDGTPFPPLEQPRRVERPNMPVVSAALTLTEHVHRHLKHYVERDGSPLLGRLIVENTKIYRAENEDHALRFPAASGALQQGGEPYPIIWEEELHTANAPGVKANGVETIKITSSKRTKNANVQRWTITNPDDGDPDSLLGERWRYASKVLEGEVVDPTQLVIHYHAELPPDGDLGSYLTDPVNVVRAVEEATPSTWMAKPPIARKYIKGEVGIGWFARFSLGLYYASDDQVLGDGVLEAAAVAPDLAGPPLPDVPVALAFDGARNRDSIALYGCTPDGYGFVVGAWERPDDAPDDWRYDKDLVHGAVVQAMEIDHPNATLGVDPTWFEDYAVNGWGGHPAWVDRWPDRVVTDVQRYGAQAWTAFRTAVIDGEFAHDGDPRLLRHMRNAKEVTRISGGRKYVQLAKKRDDGRHPIDLLVTATYALRLATTLEAATAGHTVDDWREALGVPTPETTP